MKRILLLFLMCVIYERCFGILAPLSNFEEPLFQICSSKDLQIQQIDQQIKELKEMKRGYEARALRHENQADRLQFDDRTYLEMRRHNQLAAENKAKADAVQKEIDRLEQEKAKILHRS